MTTSRLEAFSDGVIAILITIMVLGLKVPEGTGSDQLEGLWPILPTLLSYALSFVYLGIYWNNHHHMLHITERASGAILWANLHLLFWLSLIPFVTAWGGATHWAPWPAACYGIVLLLNAISFTILQAAIVRDQGPNSALKAAVGSASKEKLSLTLYIAAIPLAFMNRWISIGIYVFVAVSWLVPDPRIEHLFNEDAGNEGAAP